MAAPGLKVSEGDYLIAVEGKPIPTRVVDVLIIENALEPGQTVKKTTDLKPRGAFIKVLLENPDPSQGVSDLKIVATLGD